MRMQAFGFALVALAATAAVAAEDAPWNHLETVWDAKAELQFRLSPLLDQGLMLVLNHTPDPDANPLHDPGPPTPELSLLDLADGKAKWTLPTGLDVNCVALAGDLIVLTTHAVRTEDAAIVAAVRVTDGEVVWQLPLQDRLDCAGDSRSDGRLDDIWGHWTPIRSIGGGLVVAGDRVFLKVGQRVFCLARGSGEALWGTDVGYGLGAPLSPCGSLLLAATGDQGVRALDQQTGKIVWTTPVNTVNRVYPFGDPIYIGTRDGWFGRIDPATGAPMWQAPTGTTAPEYAEASAGKIALYLNDSVQILDAATGASDFTAPTAGVNSARSEDAIYYCPPTVQGARTGEIVAVGVADHREKWRLPIDVPGAILRHVAGNLLMIWASEVRALRPADGSLLWEWHGPTSGGYIAADSLTVDGNRICFSTEARLVGFDSQTGGCFLDASHAFSQGRVLWVHLRGDRVSVSDPLFGGETRPNLTNVRPTRVEE